MKSILFLPLLFLSVSSLAAQDFAIDQLEDSPRHHEWVVVEYDSRTVHSFVVYPETDVRTPAVIVIHENRGLTDWVRSFADQIAEAGYIAIAPDLLSGFDNNHQRTRDFASSDAARDALYELDPNQITTDLDAVRGYISSVPAANGMIAVAGFCWGGAQTFRYATNSDQFDAALVFYGSAPEDPATVQQISVPVYGFYGGNDQRINAGIPAIEQMMEEFGKTFDYEIYEGAGHAYMRSGDDPVTDRRDPNKVARDASWERLSEILSKL